MSPQEKKEIESIKMELTRVHRKIEYLQEEVKDTYFKGYLRDVEGLLTAGLILLNINKELK